MTRISSRSPVTPRPAAERAPALKAQTRKQIETAAKKLLKAGNLDFQRAPAGDSYLRVPLSKGKGPDQYSFSALIPTGGKNTDPNKAGGFLIERSGGFAGLREVAGPFSFEGKKVGKPAPFFERFLEGQKTKPGGGLVQTMRYPSDNESAEPTKPGKPGGTVQTMRYPSDNESSEPTKPTKPGGDVQTMRYPSDNENVEPAPTKPGGGVQTKRYPSDDESVEPTKPGGGAQTKRYPSDNESAEPTRPTKPGGTVQTMRYPSDNEDAEPTKPTKPGGMMQTMRYPSDNEDGGSTPIR